MFPVMMEKTLKEYFNAKDTQGNTHNGFLNAMDFTGLSIPILNEVTVSILDAYIFNRLSRCVALTQWAEYLHYDKDAKEFRIDAQFYSDFVNALFVELIQADKFNTSVLKHDFTSISAKDLKKITFGAKTTNRHYDNVIVEITKGNDTEGTTARTDTHAELAHTDTETLGAHTDNLTVGSHTDTHNIGQRVDSETLGARTDGETLGARSDSHSETAHTDTITPSDTTNEHLRFALGGNTYNSDTKDIVTNTAATNAYGATSGTSGIGQQINSSSVGEQENERTSGEQENTDIIGQQLNTNAYGAQENSTQYGAVSETDITGAQTITKTFGDENRETSARDDSETIASRIDQEEHTKHILISPEKYFEIEKELAGINAYTIFGDAVKRAFAAAYWR